MTISLRWNMAAGILGLALDLNRCFGLSPDRNFRGSRCPFGFRPETGRNIGAIVVVLGLALVLAGSAWASAPARTGLYLFYSPECEHCQVIRMDFLPTMSLDYDLQIKEYDIENLDNYKLMLEFEKRYQAKSSQVPVVIIGRYYLSGEDQIKKELPRILEEYKRKGGVDFPPCPAPAQPPPAQSATEPVTQKAATFPVYMAYFYKTGCAKCERVTYDLALLEKEYPHLTIRRMDVEAPEYAEINQGLCSSYRVPEEKHLTAPMIFIGQSYLADKEINYANLKVLVEKCQGKALSPPWEQVGQGDRVQAQQKILGRFTGMALATVMGAGLLDGINPCAFATVIFFVSYLGFIGRSRKEILGVGLTFTLAVFTTYLLVGLGLFQFARSLTFLPLIARGVYILMAVLALILGIYSFWDFLKCRKGEGREMVLQLPAFLKKRIHKVIREKSRTRNFVLAALATGFFISILELACTGQVYLPTILYVAKLPGFKLQVLPYLVLYNLCFIAPLVVVFMSVYVGVTSEQLNKLLERHMAKVKLLTSALFFALGGILLYTL